MTLIEQLANFSANASFDRLPREVVDECKRIVLDSIGVALAAADTPKGRIGIEYGRLIGASGASTIIGTAGKVSIFGAAFANGELVNAVDMDAVLPPEHVTPYVLPGALAVGESLGRSGRDLIAALAVAHEMSFRLGKAMDYLRDTQDGKVSPPPIYGYSSTVFGATAAILNLKQCSSDILAHGLGIAGSIAPVNSQAAWFQHAPSSTIKYLLAGALTQSAMTAADMAELGHRGDRIILDDREFGFPRFIGTRRWEPEHITAGLGSEWQFTAEQAYKPYPHCRILHALLDCLTEIVRDNSIRPEEIDCIKVFVEGFVEQPVWLNRRIEHVHDAQFSIAHGIALGAHQLPPGQGVARPGMGVPPLGDGADGQGESRGPPRLREATRGPWGEPPARLELHARGQVFVGEKRYPKDSPSPDPSTTLSTDELVTKFCHNAEGAIATHAIDDITKAVLALDALRISGACWI